MYPQGEGVPALHGRLCAAPGHCDHVLCPTWSLSDLLASAAEGFSNESCWWGEGGPPSPDHATATPPRPILGLTGTEDLS